MMVETSFRTLVAEIKPLMERTFLCLVHKREVLSQEGFVLGIREIQRELNLPEGQLPSVFQLGQFVACRACVRDVARFFGVPFLHPLAKQLEILEYKFASAARQVRARPIAPETVVPRTTARTGTVMPTLPPGYFESRKGQAHKGRKPRSLRQAEALAKVTKPSPATAALDKKAAKKAAKDAARSNNKQGAGGKKRH
ncbi:MAG: hypothetical protein AAB608_02630 [Patescibacteria group bacterium]